MIPFFCFMFFIFVPTQQALGILSSERFSLLELRASLGIRARNWPKKVEPCSNWTGIVCGDDGRVAGINLSGLRRTRFGQRNPSFAIDSLSNFTSLTSFNASGFLLPGSIPGWLGQRLVTLKVLDLRFCGVLGSIPVSLGNLSSLTSLYLSNNFITGEIPASLGNLHSLVELDLSRNSLTGRIPSEISRLGNLNNLSLSANFLSGAIPLEFGLLASLKSLKLDNNSLSDSIPAQLGNLSSLAELDLQLNVLSGTLPKGLGGLRSLQKLMIGNNRLEGSFPDVLSSLTSLLLLDVSVNVFTGDLPNISGFINNGALVFNFSSNLFYGNLSFGAGNISLDLSRNFFTGIAPAATKTNVTLNCFRRLPNQKNMMECRQFYKDRGIPFNSEASSRNEQNLKYILGGTFGGLGFILILGVGLTYTLQKCVKRGANKRGKSDAKPPPPEKDSTPPPVTSRDSPDIGEAFTHDQLLRASNNFSDMNLIKRGHSGDIFRGTLGAGNDVIIKRVDLQLPKKETGYSLELDFFSKVKHPRIVPLVGHCLEPENEKMFVYKYMPNGDLSSSLFRENYLEDSGLQSLDWITRLKIATGTAEAISYLHHDCNPPLVHRDIQPSSILLDDKYEVRLGSLSEVCPQGTDGSQQKIARMLRLSQSFDRRPSGLSSATCAYDVYCFGKVLLGLVTGKLEVCDSDSELENLLSNVTIYDKEMMAKIIDPSLIIDDDLLEEVWAVAIVAKTCLNPRPSRRPLMRHILRALENPFKVIREESISSGMIRTSSSRKYWGFAFFGSWQQSSSDGANLPGQTTRKEGVSGLKQAGRAGSQGSGANDHSSSNKRSSSEIFPEPAEFQDVEKQEESVN